MNKRLQQVLFVMTFFLGAGFCSNAFSQDASAQELGLTETEREKMIYSPGGEGETKIRIISSTPTKDSLSTSTVRHQPAAQAPVKPKVDSSLKGSEKSTSKDQDQDSILSFNFLYYIIQKYKLQDIVD